MKISEKVHIHSVGDAKDIKRIADTALTIATFRVENEYIRTNKIPPSLEILRAEYKTEADKLLIIANHNPEEFRNIITNFFHELGETSIPSLEAEVELMFSNMSQIKVAGDVRRDAARNIASKIIKGTAKFSPTELGVATQAEDGKKSKKRSLLSSIFTTSKGTFNPNTKDTQSGEESRTIDRDLFNTSKLYRKELEDDIKRLKTRGGMSNEELQLVAEHTRLKREQLGIDKKGKSESQKILDSMTAGEKAMYDIAKAPFLLAKGLFSLIPRKKIKENIPEVSDISKIDAKDSAHIERKESTHMEPVPSEDSAAKEAIFERKSEVEDDLLEAAHTQIEVTNKQTEILAKIDESIKEKSADSGGGGVIEAISSLSKFGQILRIAGPAIAVAGAAFAGFKFGEKLMELTGQTDEKGDVKAGSWTDKATSWLAGTDKTMEERDKEYRESPEGVKQIAELKAASADRKLAKKENLPYEVVQGTSALKAKGEKEYFDAIASGDTETARLTAETLGYTPSKTDNIESVKKDIAPKLESKQQKSDTAKEEKAAATVAGAVSNVVNNSPNNSVVAPTKTNTTGRDTPRNPDNSLNQYLNSRVTKFT